MGAPIDSAWSNSVLSDGNLNQTTYGQGTSFPSTWSTARLFWRTDSKQIYQNTGTESSPVWTQLGGSDPTPNSHILPYDQTIGNFTTATASSVSSEYVSTTPTTQTFANNQWTNVVGSQGNNNPPHDGYQSTTKTASYYPNGGNPIDIENLTFEHGERTAVGSSGWTLGYRGITVGTNDSSGWVAKGNMDNDGTTTTNLGDIDDFIGIHVYVRAYQLGQWYAVAQGDYADPNPPNPASNVSDSDATTKWTSATQANNFFTLDMGASTRSDHIAIKPDTTTTTETQFDIQTSTDNSNWTTRRRILKTALTNNAYNYIRFNPVECRYVKVLGSSGNSSVMSIYDAKVKKSITDDAMTLTHGHLTVNTTDSSLALDGT